MTNLFDLIEAGGRDPDPSREDREEREKMLKGLEEREEIDKRNIELHGWFTYFMANLSRNIVKIGKSRNVAERHESLEIIFQMKLKIIYVEMGDRESFYHEMFDKHRIGREWFELDDEIIRLVKRAECLELMKV